MDNYGSTVNITLLWIALIVLKVLGHLSLGWGWIILFPIWLPISIVIAFIAAVVIGVAIVALFTVALTCILALLGVKLDP